VTENVGLGPILRYNTAQYVSKVYILVSNNVSLSRALVNSTATATAALLLSGTFCAPPARAQNAAVTVTVDVAANRRPISPLIYGQNYAEGNLSDLNAPIHRIGGNNLTRYNWQLNADNRGNDWYFQSIADASSAPGARIDSFIQTNRTAGAESMVTVPIIGWVAKVNADRSKRWSYSIAKYGAQQDADWSWAPDAGNGVRANGSLITNNDPNDASIPVTPAFMKPWIQQIVGKFGQASAGGARYYILDNEYSIWHSTHRDVQPTGARMGEVFARMRDYAAMIKSVDPTAQIVGPEEWGWSGYFYSGYDLQVANWSNPPDRAANGGMEYVPWLLKQLRNEELTKGVRLLDVFSLHIYPQGGEFSDDVSTAMQRLRNRSTRSLWDPNYVDETWINDRVRLIPRMKEWVNTYYPGLKTAITEYNWGADGHINGATTQADILGIFGREGLDIATRWVAPDPSTPTYKAFKMYRNYDGARGTFGDVSVAANSNGNPDNLSVFASEDTKSGAVKVMVIAKALSGSTPVTLNLANYTPGATAQVWQLTSANAIRRLSDVAVSSKKISLSAPAQSVTLVVVPKGSSTPPPATVAAPTFSPAGGTYTSAQTVTISSATSGASIRYTTNGTNPTSTTGTVYSGPVSVGSTTTLKAVAYKSGMTTSAVSTATYTINIPTGPSGTGTGLRGQYFNNLSLSGTPVLTRRDTRVNFGWGMNAPNAKVPADNFSARWEGQVEAPKAGAYTFYTRSDDGVRLWVNGQLLIDNWTNHSATDDTSSTTITLAAGQKVSLRMEYFDSGYDAEARLYWSYPGRSKQVIPQAYLYPAP
jgi:Alpha-L-arabinofuranosidase